MVKVPKMQKIIFNLHRKHVSKNTRFAFQLFFRSHAFFQWLRLFYPILSENIKKTNVNDPKKQ
jgi:hypothetical protein